FLEGRVVVLQFLELQVVAHDSIVTQERGGMVSSVLWVSENSRISAGTRRGPAPETRTLVSSFLGRSYSARPKEHTRTDCSARAKRAGGPARRHRTADSRPFLADTAWRLRSSRRDVPKPCLLPGTA